MAAYEGCYAAGDVTKGKPDMQGSNIEECYAGALAAGKTTVLATQAAGGPVLCYFSDGLAGLAQDDNCLVTENAILGKTDHGTVGAYTAFPVDSPLVVLSAMYGTHDVKAKVGALFARSQTIKVSPDLFGVAGNPVGNPQTFTMTYLFGVNPEVQTLTAIDGETATLGDPHSADLTKPTRDPRYEQQLKYLSDRYALCLKLLLQTGDQDKDLQGIAKELNGQLQELVQTIREETAQTDAQMSALQKSLIGEVGRLQREYEALHKATLERNALQASVNARREAVETNGQWYDFLVAGTGLGALALLVLGV